MIASGITVAPVLANPLPELGAADDPPAAPESTGAVELGAGADELDAGITNGKAS
jgi:hypothetical protein